MKRDRSHDARIAANELKIAQHEIRFQALIADIDILRRLLAVEQMAIHNIRHPEPIIRSEPSHKIQHWYNRMKFWGKP